MSFDLGGLLQTYLGGQATSTPDTSDHFHQVAQAAPADLLSQGLAAMFRSDQTPAFGQLAGQLFGRANGAQQAGMVNELIGSMGPGVLAALLGSAGGAGPGGLGSLLGQSAQSGGAAAALSEAEVARLTPEQVSVIAAHAEQHNPGVVDALSGFYAEHASLVKTLGGAALAIALAKMADRQQA